MKPSEILREAAWRVEVDKYTVGCCAIDQIAGNDIEAVDRAFERFNLLRPERAHPTDPWWGGWSRYERPENQDARVIGLCLAAAIAESEGD